MMEALERLMVTGLGVVALSKSKADELLAEVREKYRLSEEEGKTLLEKLQAMAQQGKENLAEMADNEVKRAVRAAGMVTREEYDLLEKRVAALERQVMSLQAEDDPEA